MAKPIFTSPIPAKLPATIQAELNKSIITNGNGLITGSILNSILNDINGIPGSCFTYPAETSEPYAIDTDDIGKLLMDSGSGTAVVYRLSDAVPLQMGHWSLTVSNFDDIADNAGISITWNNQTYYISRRNWDGDDTSTQPTDALEEIQAMQAYMSGLADYSFLTFTVSADAAGNPMLDILENTFTSVDVFVQGYNSNTFSVITISMPDLPEAPTALPLGILMGIDNGNAIISSKSTDTYLLDSSIAPVDPSDFDYNTSLNITDLDSLLDLAKHIIVPSDNGTVCPLDPNTLNLDKTFFRTFRQQFLGIGIASTATTITVVNGSFVSLICSFIVRVGKLGVFYNNSKGAINVSVTTLSRRSSVAKNVAKPAVTAKKKSVAKHVVTAKHKTAAKHKHTVAAKKKK